MIYLLDVNALLSLAWEQHVHHDLVESWAAHALLGGFALCPITEIGFVRLSSNSHVMGKPVSVSEAFRALELIQQKANSHFWPADVSFSTTAINGGLRGHNEVTDAYLLLLARQHGGTLATLDRGAAALGSLLNCPVHLITPV